YPRLEVQAAFPVADLGVVEVEHLSVDRQSQKGRIGHVDDRLARGGETIGRLGIDDRPCLVEAVDEGAALVDGSPLVERPPDPEATVAEGQHGLEQGGQLSGVGGFDDRPAVDGIEIVGKFRCDLGLLHGTNSARSSTTTAAPALERASPSPCRATPITAPKPPATPASTPATASSITTARLGSVPSRRTASRKVSGAGFPGIDSAAATTPSIRTGKRSRIPAASSTCSALAEDDTTAIGIPSASRWSKSAT